MSGKVPGISLLIVSENCSPASWAKLYWTGVEEREFWGPGHHGRHYVIFRFETTHYFTGMLLPHLSLREERTSCLSSSIACTGPLLHPPLEPFASMTSHLLSSLPLYINRPIPGKHLQTITISPLTTHFYKSPLPWLQFTSPTSFGYIPSSILSCAILKCIFYANTYFPTRLQAPWRQGPCLVLLSYPQQDISQCKLPRTEIIWETVN